MARIRQIKPVFFIDDDLAACSRDARFFFVGLWVLADRAGRLEDRPARMKAQIFPYDADITIQEIEGYLDQLNSRHFIVRYVANGKRLIQIRSFEKHQHCHIKEPDSELPPPEAPDKHRISTMQEPDKPDFAPDKYGASTVQAPGKYGAKPVQDQISESEEVTKARCKYGASTVQAPVLHRSSTSASGYMDNGNDFLSVGVGSSSGEGGLGEEPKPAVLEPPPAHWAADFVLTDELRQWSETAAPNLDPEIEAEKFRDHYARNGKRFASLPAAFRKWMRDGVDRLNQARAPTGRWETVTQRNARIFAEVEAEDAAKARQAEQGMES